MSLLNSKDRERPLVLHVDDNEQQLRLTRIVLEELGLAVESTSDGHEGIEIAEKKNPDLILLDATMPLIDGFETCRKLKENPRTKHIPVVMLTSNENLSDINQAIDSGAMG